MAERPEDSAIMGVYLRYSPLLFHCALAASFAREGEYRVALRGGTIAAISCVFDIGALRQCTGDVQIELASVRLTADDVK